MTNKEKIQKYIENLRAKPNCPEHIKNDNKLAEFIVNNPKMLKEEIKETLCAYIDQDWVEYFDGLADVDFLALQFGVCKNIPTDSPRSTKLDISLSRVSVDASYLISLIASTKNLIENKQLGEDHPVCIFLNEIALEVFTIICDNNLERSEVGEFDAEGKLSIFPPNGKPRPTEKIKEVLMKYGVI